MAVLPEVAHKANKPTPWPALKAIQAPQTVLPGTEVFLDGSSARVQMVEGEILRPASGKNPQWSMGAKPAGSKLTDSDIQHNTSKTARFLPDVEGLYTLNLNVERGDNSQAYEMHVNVSTTNVPPAAAAGDGGDVLLGDTVALDASGSSDENNLDTLTYKWTVLTAPSGSKADTASLNNPSLPSAISKLSGSSYYLFFAACMFVWGILYIPVAMWFKEETFIQDGESEGEA
jgi:hypothetical protein